MITFGKGLYQLQLLLLSQHLPLLCIGTGAVTVTLLCGYGWARVAPCISFLDDNDGWSSTKTNV